MSIHSQIQDFESCAPQKLQLPTEPRSTGPVRDAAIDFTKGALVLFMVLYHWLNYFVGSNGHYYNYLRFLTPSFIFISGFMISRIQLSRHQDQSAQLAKRLAMRGLKLLALVFFLNALVSFVRAGFDLRSAVWKTSFGYIFRAFVVANPSASVGQKSVAFSMLVPIAYLLILSSILVLWAKQQRDAFRYTLCALVVAVIFSYSYGMVSSYLDLLMIGVLGVVIGFTDNQQTALVLSHPYMLIVLYGGYLAVISIWNVTLPWQVVSVILTTALLYIAGSKWTPGRAWHCTVLLGKYSLLGYISQIAILQALKRLSWFSQHGVAVLLASLLSAMLLTAITVEATDFARRKSSFADGLYRFVFA